MARPRAKYTIEAEDRSEQGLDRARGRLTAFGRTMTVAIGNVIADIGQRIAGWAVDIADSTAALDDFAGRMSDLNTTLEEQAAIDLFAELQGSTPQEVGQAIEDVQEKLAELGEGAKEVRRDFQALGLSAEDLEGLGGFAQMLTVGARLNELGPEGVGIRRRFFGTGAGRLFSGDFIGSAQRAGELGLTEGLGPRVERAERLADMRTEIGALATDFIQRRPPGIDLAEEAITTAIRDGLIAVAEMRRGDSGEFTLTGEKLLIELQNLNAQTGQVVANTSRANQARFE